MSVQGGRGKPVERNVSFLIIGFAVFAFAFIKNAAVVSELPTAWLGMFLSGCTCVLLACCIVQDLRG